RRPPGRDLRGGAARRRGPRPLRRPPLRRTAGAVGGRRPRRSTGAAAMIQGFLAYLMWGAFPLYFPLLQPAGPVEILAHRFVWTLAFMALVLAVVGTWRELRRASARTWGAVTLAATFIAINWG